MTTNQQLPVGDFEAITGHRRYRTGTTMTTNQERAAEILSEYDLEPRQADFAAQELADAGLLMPDLPDQFIDTEEVAA